MALPLKSVCAQLLSRASSLGCIFRWIAPRSLQERYRCAISPFELRPQRSPFSSACFIHRMGRKSPKHASMGLGNPTLQLPGRHNFSDPPSCSFNKSDAVQVCDRVSILILLILSSVFGSRCSLNLTFPATHYESGRRNDYASIAFGSSCAYHQTVPRVNRRHDTLGGLSLIAAKVTRPSRRRARARMPHSNERSASGLSA